jgi:hypothetical protein
MKRSAGGDDPRMSNQQREKEAKLAQRFWMAVYPLGTAKLWGFLLSGNYGARESQFRADCKHLEQPVRDAAKIGAAGGALALLSLRGARALYLRNLVRRRDLLYGAGQIHAAPHQQQRYKALDELVRQRKRFLSLTNVFGWVLDVSAALAASAVTAGVSVDTVSLMAAFMTVPLDPEGSALASAFCPGALGALQALREESPENARIIDGQQHQPPRSLPLSYMLGFCANCQQWEILERLRSQEKLRRIREMVKLQRRCGAPEGGDRDCEGPATGIGTEAASPG